MKTTLIIDDKVYRDLKAKAAREKRTLSELVDSAIRLLLEKRQAPPPTLEPLPTFRMGRTKVDVADRNALYDAMERG